MTSLPGVRVGIVGEDNGYGLSRDAAILDDLLSAAGARVRRHGEARRPGIRWLGGRLPSLGRIRPAHDITILLQQPSAAWLAWAPLRVLVPNPEWFFSTRLGLLPQVDLVCAKTRDAEGLFRGLGANVTYTGFTSTDRLDAAVARRREVLHVAGRTPARRGTTEVVSAWQRHPDWPLLHLVLPVENPDVVQMAARCGNVRVHRGRVADAELRRLQNVSQVHVLPSETEGFGHMLVEGLSCGAIVVTTDAPPMNEVIPQGTGVLVPWAESHPMNLGKRYRVATEALESTVGGLFAEPSGRWAARGEAARARYEACDAGFRSAFVQALCRLHATTFG